MEQKKGKTFSSGRKMAQNATASSYCDVFVNKISLILLSVFQKLHCFKRLQDISQVTVKQKIRSSHQEVFFKKGVLKNFAKFTVKHLCLSFKIVVGLRTLAQVFSVEFYEIFKNTFNLQNTSEIASNKKHYSHYID